MDVLAGRPSATLRRVALLAFLGWAAAALRRDAPPAVLRGADARLRALGWPPWKLLLALFAAWQAIDGAFLLLFLNPPEPARGLYKPAYFRAVQILTAMDAGFWTVMNIGPAPLRHVLSILASVYFLLRPRLAEDTVRRFRSQATVRHLRLGWNKAQVNPILRAVRWITADKIAVVREVFLPRPQPASPSAFEGTPPPIRTLLFFNGTDAELAKADAMVLHLPGGGFVSMPPEVHSDYLRLWAKVTGLPVLSIDYGKAPEFPYPWALEECFDAYRTLVESNGAAIGMCGWYAEVNGVRRRRKPIRIAVTGDSAGGNLAVSMTYRILEHPTHHLPAPSGLLLTYPNLTFDMAAWMPSDEVELLRKESRMGLARATSSSSVGRVNGLSPPASRGSQTSLARPAPPGSILLRNPSAALLVPPADPGPDSAEAPDLRRKRTLSFVEKQHRGGLAALSSPDGSAKKKAPMPSSRSAADLRALETTTPLAAAPCPAPAGQEDREGFLWRVWDRLTGFRAAPSARKKAAPASHKNISMTSRFAYSADPMLPPETVRSLALLYIGNSPQQPDFGSDYFLNPVVAPDDLLARFPKIYLVCGEKDPLVDDTVIFAGRVREAKSRAHREWLRLREELRRNKDAPAPGQHWNPSDLPSHPFAREPADMVHTRIIEGISHGFLNYMALFPEARDVALVDASWLLDLVAEDDRTPRRPPYPGYVGSSGRAVLAEEELTELLLTRMERGDGPLADATEVPARAGYYASVPAVIHRYLHPEIAGEAVHSKEVREKWEKEAEDLGLSDSGSEDEGGGWRWHDAEHEADRPVKPVPKAGAVPVPSLAPAPGAAGQQAKQQRKATPVRSNPAAASRARTRAGEGGESEDDLEEEEGGITMSVGRARPPATVADLKGAVSDLELVKRRKEETEHALTDFHESKK